MNIKIFILIIISLLPKVAIAQDYINIGTGSKSALAYPTMSNICNIYEQYKTPNILCNVVSTKGSQENLEKIEDGSFQMGIMKASMQYDRYRGENKEPSKLRTLFGLHYEYFTIMVQSDEQIDGFLDLKNKRVNIPNPGSGSRILYEQIMQKYNLSSGFFKEIYEDDISNLGNLFCNDKIDAAIFFVGHPNQGFSEALSKCNIKLVSFSKQELENYLDLSEYYTYITLPKNTYPNQKSDILTFGSQLILSASSELSEDNVYDFTKIFFTHFDEITESTPTLKDISPVQIFNVGGIAPVHKGAIRYYHERILLSAPD